MGDFYDLATRIRPILGELIRQAANGTVSTTTTPA
jgi:hypothetical protein